MIAANFVINKGFKWYTEGNASVKGFLFNSEGEYFEREKFLKLIKSIHSKDSLIDLIKTAKGLFTIFIQLSGSEFILTNDVIRSFPVFYKLTNNLIQLSDDIEFIIKNSKNVKINPVSKSEFLSAGFVSGKNTLIESVHITQSGEVLSFKDGILSIEPYCNYAISKNNKKGKEFLLKDSKDFIDRTFERLLESLNGRMAVIPLSGGLDSRLIACKLKALGHKKILCYTFGNALNNPEKSISEKVARKLELDWVFIEYNKDNVGEFINDSEFREYYNSYSQYSSSFMFQDYFAVRYLKYNNIIPKDAVFIPGYSGDFLGGSQLYKNGGIKYNASVDRIAGMILKYRYINSTLAVKDKNVILKKIKKQLCNSTKDVQKLFAYSVFENWEIKENLSKFIGQAAHIYDFFGYEYRLPYWDKELLYFFRDVPYGYKYGKTLYNETLYGYFKELGVDFREGVNLSPKEFRLYTFKQFAKSLIPSRFLRRYSLQKDTLNYDFILGGIKDELNGYPDFKEDVILTQNSYIAHWYLMQIEKGL